MTAKQFIYWLKGYLKAVSKDKPIDELINEVMAELEKVSEKDLSKADKEAEKNIEDWIKEINKQNPIKQYPFPDIQPAVVMYGCQTAPFKFNPNEFTITSSTTYINKPKDE